MTTNLPLQGRVALIAGAGGPLGRVVAVALAEGGADLALSVASQNDADVFAMNSIANELWALDRRQIALTMDFAEPQSVSDAVERAIGDLGRLDLLVTLPPAQMPSEPFVESAPTALTGAIEQRLGGVLLLCRAAGAVLLRRGAGSVLNVVNSPDQAALSVAARAAEAGVLGLTRPLAAEWTGRIAVNAAVQRDGTAPATVASLATMLATALPAEGAGPISGQVFEL
jgi:NAD(P)-dependent dehydrogenase (short-subunit alcohol dehydrogenase family)